MKKIISLILCIGFIFFAFIGVSTAGLYTTGDMNSDGKIGLEEAILALKIVAGISFQGGDESESNDFESEADEISPVSNTSGKIGYSGDQEDWFKIVVPENGLLQATIENLNSENATNGDLGECIVFQKDASNLVEIAEISRYSRIEANKIYTSKPLPVFKDGVYYIKVAQREAHVAPYELRTSFIKLQLTDSGEPNSNYSEAHVLQEKQTITSLIGYGSDEEDWYMVQMSENGIFQISVENLNSEDVGNARIEEGILYQKVGADLVEIAEAGSYYIEPGDIGASPEMAVAKDGIYFIKVFQYGYNASPYQLSTSMTTMQTVDFGEPNDSRSEAQVLQDNQTITSLIGYSGDKEDWYMVQIPADGMFQFSVENLNSDNIGNGRIEESILYQRVGADLVQAAEAGSYYIEPGEIGACPEVAVAKDAIYYIKVFQYGYNASPYQLQTSFTPN